MDGSVPGVADQSRRRLLHRLGGIVFSGLLAAACKQPVPPASGPPARSARPPTPVSPRAARVGVLRVGHDRGHLFDHFVETLGQWGYSEGQNLSLHWQPTVQDELAGRATDLIRTEVDVIFAPSTAASIEAQRVTSTVPIVMISADDPLAVGLISDPDRPGSNITGVSSFARDTGDQRVALLRELVPAATRVAVLADPDDPDRTVDLRQLHAAASAQGVTLWRFDLRSTGDIADAFAAIRDERLDALVAFGDPLFITRVPFSLVPSLARSQRVAALYDRRGFADVGGLASYGPDPPTMWRSAASYVAQVLQGRTPAALPVAFVAPELVLNDRAAKALGLTLPTSAVSRATEVLR